MSTLSTPQQLEATPIKRKQLSTMSPSAPVQVGSDIEQVLDEVFLSPRVLDRTAFERFASTLAELIRRAGAERQALEAAAARSERVGEDIRVFQSEHPEAFERTTSLARSLAERASQASAMIERASERSADLDRRAATAVKSLREGAGGFEASVRTMLETLGRKVEQIERETEARARRAEMRWVDRLSAAERRAEELEARLEAQQKRIDDLNAESSRDMSTIERGLREKIDSIRQEALGAVSVLEDKAGATTQRVSSMIDDTEARAGRAIERIETLERVLMSAGEVASKLDALRNLIEKADALTGNTGIESLIDRAHEAGARAEFAQRQYQEIAKQADKARIVLGESIVSSTEIIDRLGEKQDKLRENVQHSLDLCSKTTAKLTRERNKLSRALDEVVDDAADRADSITKAISAQRESIDLSGRATERLLGTARETVTLLRAAVDEAKAQTGRVTGGADEPVAKPAAKKTVRKKATRRKRTEPDQAD